MPQASLKATAGCGLLPCPVTRRRRALGPDPYFRQYRGNKAFLYTLYFRKFPRKYGILPRFWRRNKIASGVIGHGVIGQNAKQQSSDTNTENAHAEYMSSMEAALADYVQAALMLNYNKRIVG